MLPERASKLASSSHPVARKLKLAMGVNRRQLLAASLLLVGLFSSTVCQDFEDLNNQHPAGAPQSATSHKSNHNQQTFSPPNRQQQHTSGSAGKHSMQRPILSTRFVPNGLNQAPPSGLSAQASNSASVFAGPNSPQSAAQVVAPQQVPAQAAPAPALNGVEQLMKNALARTAQMNVAPESRQDSSGSANEPLPVNSPSSSPAKLALSAIAPQPVAAESAVAVTPATVDANASAEGANQDANKSAEPHETVYSDQRFANLFARRSNTKKSRIQPTEQVKAKPTLPSFIKSLPDPKQFNAAQAATQDRVTASSSSSNTFASQRVQQANQGRINLANQQAKKAIITSNSANIANNKRSNSLAGKPSPSSPQTPASPSPNSGKSSTTTNQKATSGQTSAKPALLGNNPFNRAQGSSSDPANVIAMARKRLLANNALETAKLKQQQTKPALPTRE